MRKFVPVIVIAMVAAACAFNTVTREEIESVKPGSRITYRYEKGGKTWFYADRVTRVEGDTVFYNPSKMESDSAKDGRIDDYDTTRELSIRMEDLVKFQNEHGPDDKRIIWIQ